MQKKSLDVYKQAFKAYDIRDLFDVVIDEPFAFLMGKAMGKYMRQTFSERATTFLLGSDTRPANNSLISYFVAGMEESGYYDIVAADFDPAQGYAAGIEMSYGVCSSSVMYYIGRGDFDMGCTFTASHNGKEYVGMKFFDINGEFIASSVLFELFEIAYRHTEEIPDDVTVELQSSSLPTKKKEALFSFLDGKYSLLMKYHQFAVDFSHGSGVAVERDFLQSVLQEKNHRISFLNDICDGSFPAHESDTIVEANFAQLKKEVLDNGLEFGMMFDGDADRIAFVSNTGKFVNGDVIVAIIAKQLLDSYQTPHAFEKKVVYDVMSTRAIVEKVRELGGEPILSKVGRLFINERMKQENALFGGELSGHYMFAELGGCELTLLALYYVIKESENYNSFDEMIQEYTRGYYKGPSINVHVDDKDIVIEKIAFLFEHYQPQRVDGVNVYGEDFFVTVRKSNTEPLVRIVAEAQNKEAYDALIEQIMDVVENNSLDDRGDT